MFKALQGFFSVLNRNSADLQSLKKSLCLLVARPTFFLSLSSLFPEVFPVLMPYTLMPKSMSVFSNSLN